MAEKHFFNLLKDKMAELRPSEQHREHDWAALGERLNHALPQKPRERRRAIVLPLLLLAALLSTNAAWWQSNHRDRATMAKLETTVADLQARMAAATLLPKETVRTDTVWRTVFVRLFDKAVNSDKAINSAAKDEATVAMLPLRQVRTGSIETPEGLDSITEIRDLSNLKLPQMALLERPGLQTSPIKLLVSSLLNDKKATEPFGQNFLKALRPQFFKVGASAGWLYASSPALMHQGGFSCNIRGQIGLSRHWSILTDFGISRVHYKSHTPEAILGAPSLPLLPSMEHHFTEIDVTGQKVRQFDLGLRYTFAQPGKPRPFLGLGWGGQTLLPFAIEYEIQHKHSGIIQKEVFKLTTKTQLRNVIALNAGIEIPLSPRFDLNLEGFYRRQWKKPHTKSPDLGGIRAGLSWHF